MPLPTSIWYSSLFVAVSKEVCPTICPASEPLAVDDFNSSVFPEVL